MQTRSWNYETYQSAQQRKFSIRSLRQEVSRGKRYVTLVQKWNKTSGWMDSRWKRCWNHCGVWVSVGSRWPPLPSPLRQNAELEEQFSERRRQEMMALRSVENNLLSQSSQLQGSSSGTTFYHDMIQRSQKWYQLFPLTHILLQKESATWRWTPTPWLCPCQTQTPGQQPWTTWGCPRLEWVDSSSCQVIISHLYTKILIFHRRDTDFCKHDVIWHHSMDIADSLGFHDTLIRFWWWTGGPGYEKHHCHAHKN